MALNLLFAGLTVASLLPDSDGARPSLDFLSLPSSCDLLCFERLL